VANDILMDRPASVLLTGPNMAGKSTLMRQVALSALLMQAGSFVPAREASLPVFTRILTRIGASDSLAEGLSTFMVEMKETAELIGRADERSLVILDEIGRGTATFDGMALAQAILEHLHVQKKCTLLFATHYHELAELEGLFQGVRNFHMAIQDKNGEVKFLYRLERGPAEKSYGIHVGTLAGLPPGVTRRAKEILALREKPGTAASPLAAPQMDLFDSPVADGASTELAGEIRELDLNNLTPLSALLKISEWHQRLSSAPPI
jgi:DNA mismatch repair protein MutS